MLVVSQPRWDLPVLRPLHPQQSQTHVLKVLEFHSPRELKSFKLGLNASFIGLQDEELTWVPASLCAGGAHPKSQGDSRVGTLKECSCTGSCWRELEYRGCSFWVLPSCPMNTRLTPGTPSCVISCISGWCWPLIRRNSSGTDCNEALPGLPQDRDDRGGISMRVAGFPCRQQDFHVEAGSEFGFFWFFFPSFLPLCCQHRF